jgi:predicted metal-binding membrane protein
VSGPATPAIQPKVARAEAEAFASVPPLGSSALLWLVGSLIAGAWLIAFVAEITGEAQALHHHALLSSGGPPLWLAVPLSLLSWQVMTAAMMLPSSLPALRAFGVSRPVIAIAAFLGAYAITWSAYGLAAFFGDAGLHAFVHATPWLAARPQLVGAAVLAIAGAYQLLPVKHRGLAACRQPDDRGSIVDPRNHRSASAGLHAGLRHAFDCVASSWALMLLMFAAGFANLAWMAILTAVMTYETMGRHGHRIAAVFGCVLLGLAGAEILGLVPAM